LATYAENAASRERAARKGAQDRFLSAQQQHFDADVKANTDKRGGWKRMKYERAEFTVVTASDAFREGYDKINWKSPQAAEPVHVTADDKGGKATT
jgi:hypothetical protein